MYVHYDLRIFTKIGAYNEVKIQIFLYTDSWSSDIKESVTAGSIIVFSNGDRKMAAKMANSSLPNEQAISSLDSPCLQSHDRSSAS